MKILVMGAGAIGCFVGGSLAAIGQPVTLVGRDPLMSHIAEHGLKILWPGDQAKLSYPLTRTSLPLEDPFDLVLLTVKAPDTAPAINQLAPLLARSKTSQIVSLQNGLGNEEQLAAAFGPERTIAGTITLPIQVPEPGVIQVSKAKGGLGLAPLPLPPPASGLAPVRALAQALNRAALPTQIYPNYRAMKWSKLLLNIVNNPICAILNQPPAQVVAQPALFNLEIMALQEAVAVMRAEGSPAVPLPGYPVQWLARLVGARWLPKALIRAILRPFMLSGRGTKMPSLQIDLAAGRATSEIDHLNGAIVAAGEQMAVPTPVNQALTNILSGLVTGNLAWEDYQDQPANLLAAVATGRQP